MLHTYKLYGTRIVVDIESGAFHFLDELDFDMLRYLEYPLEKNTLSTLRYDLARYESSDVSAAFSKFERLNKDGVFACDEEKDKPETVVSQTAVIPDITVGIDALRPVFATEVIRAVDSGAHTVGISDDDVEHISLDDFDIVESELERLAKEIAKRKLGKIPGEVFEFVPFAVPTFKDAKGYDRIADRELVSLLVSEPSNANDAFKRKCLECGIMLLSI
ncbi:MAG: hypothetical protein IKB34_01030 [Clostridia bacterium]|nr:hypothetical protein [Clostridia bacterium]